MNIDIIVKYKYIGSSIVNYFVRFSLTSISFNFAKNFIILDHKRHLPFFKTECKTLLKKELVRIRFSRSQLRVWNAFAINFSFFLRLLATYPYYFCLVCLYRTLSDKLLHRIWYNIASGFHYGFTQIHSTGWSRDSWRHWKETTSHPIKIGSISTIRFGGLFT